MGQIMKVGCSCGFSKTVRIGGGMRDHQTNSTFPHYCESCGLVDVNVMASPLQCSYCLSEKVVAYGQQATSLPSERRGIQWGKFDAPVSGNLCPQCKQMTLEFKGTVMMFD